MVGFQTAVSYQPAPAVVGDFASANPRRNVLAGPGGLVAGAEGVTIGRMAWLSARILDSDGAAAVVVNHGAGPPAGFIHREQQAFITTYLQESGMVIPGGFQVTVHDQGDFWAQNDGATQANPGMTAYADLATGKLSFGAASSPSTAVVTGAIAASTASVTGSITDNQLTVTAVGSGVLVPGGVLSGTNVVAGTQIVSQISSAETDGALGKKGVYSVTPNNQTVASTTISETYGTLTVSGVTSGAVGVGDVLSGSGVTAGTTITQLGTGTGGTGTYIVSPTQTASSTTVTAGTSVATRFYAMSVAAPGELVKITSYPLN